MGAVVVMMAQSLPAAAALKNLDSITTPSTACRKRRKEMTTTETAVMQEPNQITGKAPSRSRASSQTQLQLAAVLNSSST